MDIRVLVAVASKHGATERIAQRVGHALSQALGARGLCVELDVCTVDRVRFLDRFDAVVVGSAVYAGHWLGPATRFVEANREVLRDRPVWLFSSRPIGDPLRPAEESAAPRKLAEAIGALDHRVFGGTPDRASLSLAERAIAKALGAPEGDFRDWEAVDAWAGDIACELAALRQQAAGSVYAG
ncbi:MAG: flavodoxin domain-containing protein [Actinomycetota bacterium]